LTKKYHQVVSPIETRQVLVAALVSSSTRGRAVAERVILRELFEREAIVPSTLADMLGMSRGAISKLADCLAVKELITQKANRQDRQDQVLALTAKGRALLAKLSALADQNDTEFLGQLEGGERVLIESAMKEIVRQLDLRSISIN
jgi:DNA-binding MarR family transcriptional regulator